jgi:hypothetical protein
MYLLYIGIYVNVGKTVTGKNCKRTIRYQRPNPPVPTTYADVRLAEEYTTTTNNQQFLQYDNEVVGTGGFGRWYRIVRLQFFPVTVFPTFT